MDPEPSAGRNESREFPVAFAIGLLIVAFVVGAFILLTRSIKPQGPGSAQKLSFDAADQSYAPNVHFTDLDLSHSSNLLNQEFVYATGKVSNDGNRPIVALEVTLEFHDPFNQVILRESQRVIDAPAAPLPPGQQRDFQVTIERKIPSEWNQQYPSIRVAGLVLQ